jgi:hypothetical protein
VSDPTPATDAPAGRRYQQQLARTLRVAGNMTITLSVIGPAASVFAIGSVALSTAVWKFVRGGHAAQVCWSWSPSRRRSRSRSALV